MAGIYPNNSNDEMNLERGADYRNVSAYEEHRKTEIAPALKRGGKMSLEYFVGGLLLVTIGLGMAGKAFYRAYRGKN